jgi:2-acylglycerol O-acyltransferase 2
MFHPQAVIIPGGLNEAQKTTPNQNRVSLKDRKGFVKVALESGSPLVPIYTFGEIDLFDRLDSQHRPCWVIYAKIIKALFGYKITICGNYMPKQIPLVTVIGAPIEVTQKDQPTQADVDELHDKFCAELKSIFDTHKSDYYGDDSHTLIIE